MRYPRVGNVSPPRPRALELRHFQRKVKTTLLAKESTITTLERTCPLLMASSYQPKLWENLADKSHTPIVVRRVFFAQDSHCVRSIKNCERTKRMLKRLAVYL